MNAALQLDYRNSYAGQLARQLVEQRRYVEAANAFRLATHDDPYCTEWWLGLAECSLRLGERSEAIEAYVAATEIDPHNAAIHNKMGCLEKHPRLAEEAFRAAIAADSQCARYHANLAVSLFRQWRFDEAEGYIRTALRLEPDDITYAVDLGHMLMELERYSGAKAVFRRAATSRRHDAVLVGRAWKFYEEQRYEACQALFSHRSRTPYDHDLAWAYQGFGLALRKQGETRPAIIAFRAAVSLNPELAVFHRNLGDALSAANRSAQAAAAYERARQLGGTAAEVRQRWSIALREQAY